MAIAAGLGTKIILFLGLVGSATLLPFSLTFLITDLISEIYGKNAAKKCVWIGLWTILAVFVLIRIAIIWPAAPFWKDQEPYARIFGGSLRIIAGGILSYLVSQLHDVWAFHFWRKVTRGRHLWLRNNLSTMVSQLINTIIFISIAFYGIQPIGPLFLGHYLGKVAVAALDTPFIYAGAYLLRKHLGLQPQESIALFEGD
jgi:uncharacterized integral membrane protein (TIGR00697 family)